MTRLVEYGPAWGAAVLIVVLAMFVAVGIHEWREERRERES